jgi:hypothetical protein
VTSHGATDAISAIRVRVSSARSSLREYGTGLAVGGRPTKATADIFRKCNECATHVIFFFLLLLLPTRRSRPIIGE